MRNLLIFILTLILNLSMLTYSFTTDNSEQTVQDAQRSLSGLDEIAKKIVALFPKVEGKILSVDKNIVMVNIGVKDGVSPDMRLTVFREGKEFLHPITKVVMGRFETYLGLLEIKEVMEETSLGLILEQKEEIKTGDKVRITSGRIGIAFIYTEKVDKDTVGSFSEVLEGTGRFRIIEDEKVKATIEKEGFKGIGLEAKEDIKWLARILDVEGIVFLDLKPTTKGPFLKVDLIHTFDGKLLGTYEALITKPEKKDIEFPLPERKDYWKAFDFNYKARLLGIGDLDGDGRKEIVISDGTRIRIYRFEDSNLSEIWTDKENKGDNHIAIDVADINRDGKAEVFVTNYGDSLRSFVIEYREGGYKRIWDDVPLFFRVIDIPGKGETLIAQELDDKIYEYSSGEGGYIKGKSIRLPPNVEIYGFAFIDWERKGAHDILVMDDDDYLNLYSPEGMKIWKSKDRYGGYALSFERSNLLSGERTEKVRVKGRIIVKDYKESGRQKAIIIRNIPITYLFRDFRGYRNAEVILLGWNGSEMIEEWRIGKIDGFIADYGIGDITNTGKESLFLLINPTIRIVGGKSIRMPGLGDVLSGKSYLLLYHLPNR